VIPKATDAIDKHKQQSAEEWAKKVASEADAKASAEKAAEDSLFVERYAGVSACFQDIHTAFEIGVNYLEFKSFVFNLKSEWNKVSNKPIIERHKYNIIDAQIAVDEYVKTLDFWGKSINDDAFKYTFSKYRDEHREKAMIKSKSFLSEYNSANN